MHPTCFGLTADRQRHRAENQTPIAMRQVLQGVTDRSRDWDSDTD